MLDAFQIDQILFANYKNFIYKIFNMKIYGIALLASFLSACGAQSTVMTEEENHVFETQCADALSRPTVTIPQNLSAFTSQNPYELDLQGTINFFEEGWKQFQAELFEDVDRSDESATTIVFINSFGGKTNTAARTRADLETVQGRLITICKNRSFSMAAEILQSGDIRFADEGCIIGLHRTQFWAFAIDRSIDDVFFGDVRDFYMQRTGLSEACTASMFVESGNFLLLRPQEALRLNLLDAVILHGGDAMEVREEFVDDFLALRLEN